MQKRISSKSVQWWLTAYLVGVLLGTFLLIGGVVPETWFEHWPWWGRLLLVLLGAPFIAVGYALISAVVDALPYLFKLSPVAGVVVIGLILVLVAAVAQ